MRGSVTVFFSLIITLCFSLFFSMTEVIRIVEMNQRAQTLTQEALNSALSEYQPGLWETYNILGLDGAYGTDSSDISMVSERLSQFCYMNTSDEEVSGSDFTRIALQNVSINSYSLLTDNNGLLFRKQAATAAKSIGIESGVETLLNVVDSSEEDSDSLDVEDLVNAANSAMESADEESEEDEVESTGQTVTEEIDVDTVDNPLTVYKTLTSTSWLKLVVSDISSKSISTSSVVSKRTLNTGNSSSTDSLSTTEALLYYYYLTQEFGYYGNSKSSTCLEYELEYIVAGKSSDQDNLESIVTRLIALREAANYITIMSSPSLYQKTYNLAVAIAGITANAVIILAVQQAIVAVWALVESILDVRTLLSGGKVALTKSSATWTSNLYTLATYLSTSHKAKESSTGVTYVQYLTAFVALLGEKNKGLRPLDLIEKNLQQQDDYVNLKMDNIIEEMSVTCVYDGSAMFLSYITTNTGSTEWYTYSTESSVSY